MPEGSVFLYLSDLLGRRVRSADGSFSGRLVDLVVSFSEKFPEIEAAVFSTRGGRRTIRMDPRLCGALLSGGIMEGGAGDAEPPSDPGWQHLRRVLLDKQVVDVKGAKVVRVNDIHLLAHSGRIFLVHVDIGLTGLARRLGIDGWLARTISAFGGRAKDELVSWRFVQPLPAAGNEPVKLTLRQEQLRQLHPGELADIIEELDPGERLAMVRSFDTGQVADVLEEAEEAVQAAIICDLDSATAADILEEMEPAAAVDIVGMLPEHTQQDIMAEMEDTDRALIERLSRAEDDTAASLMTVEYLSCPVGATVGDALGILAGNASGVQFIGYMYCLEPESGRLSGVLSLRTILSSPPATPVAGLMNRRLTSLSPDDDLDRVAELFMKFRLHALPVVDGYGAMEGIVAFEHAFDELLPRLARLAAEAAGEARRPGLWRRTALFLAVMGPGIITANVDNDAGGLATYSQAGAQFGLRLLWLMIPITIFLVMVQEMVNRMGVVTGRGLSDMIRERFGVRVTFSLMLLILATNFANITAEFAGIASAGQILGLPPQVAVPVCTVLVWLLVTKASYRSVERVFLVACIFYLAYPVTLFIMRPDLSAISRAFVQPDLDLSGPFVVMAVGLIGTTIAPWMQFYQQASVAEKNIPVNDYAYSRLDTVLGCIVVSLVASCIVITCAGELHATGIPVENAADAARALEPLAGRLSSYLFAFGLLNASVFAASILPLSTSYTICEAFGWESGVGRDFRSAPQFYVLYTALLVLGAGSMLIPGIPYMKVMFWSQVINGVVLPVVLVFMLILVNDASQMGSHVNGRLYNAACIAVIGLIAAVSLAMPVTLILD